MTVLGVVPVFITTRRAIDKKEVHTRQLLYVVKELQGTFMSQDILKAFPLLPAGPTGVWESLGSKCFCNGA